MAGLFKSISMYRLYKRVIAENSSELLSKYNLRIDDANRLYTVLNIPEEIVGEAYSLRKADIDSIADKFLREYSSDLAGYLNSKGLAELYDFYDVKKVDKYSYLMVVGFSLFRTDKRRERALKYWLPVSVSALALVILALVLL